MERGTGIVKEGNGEKEGLSWARESSPHQYSYPCNVYLVSPVRNNDYLIHIWGVAFLSVFVTTITLD